MLNPDHSSHSEEGSDHTEVMFGRRDGEKSWEQEIQDWNAGRKSDSGFAASVSNDENSTGAAPPNRGFTFSGPQTTPTSGNMAEAPTVRPIPPSAANMPPAKDELDGLPEITPEHREKARRIVDDVFEGRNRPPPEFDMYEGPTGVRPPDPHRETAPCRVPPD